jgi:hypothetical protein
MLRHSIRTWQPADRELDAIARQDAPTLDLGLICGFGKAAQQLARLLARSRTRQRVCVTSEGIDSTPDRPAGENAGAAASNIGRSAVVHHGGLSGRALAATLPP